MHDIVCVSPQLKYYHGIRMVISCSNHASTALVIGRQTALLLQYHDDVIKWKHFRRYWAFVRGIHRSPMNSPHRRPVTRSFGVFFDLRLNKQLSKQSRCWWFEMPSRPLWRHCKDGMHANWTGVSLISENNINPSLTNVSPLRNPQQTLFLMKPTNVFAFVTIPPHWKRNMQLKSLHTEVNDRPMFRFQCHCCW